MTAPASASGCSAKHKTARTHTPPPHHHHHHHQKTSWQLRGVYNKRELQPATNPLLRGCTATQAAYLCLLRLRCLLSSTRATSPSPYPAPAAAVAAAAAAADEAALPGALLSPARPSLYATPLPCSSPACDHLSPASAWALNGWLPAPACTRSPRGGGAESAPHRGPGRSIRTGVKTGAERE